MVKRLYLNNFITIKLFKIHIRENSLLLWLFKSAPADQIFKELLKYWKEHNI